MISRKKCFTFFIFGFIERGITGFGRSETENRGHGGPGNFFGGNNVIPCIFGSGRNENSIEESKLVHTYKMFRFLKLFILFRIDLN